MEGFRDAAQKDIDLGKELVPVAEPDRLERTSELVGALLGMKKFRLRLIRFKRESPSRQTISR